jgi:hypothetical protein
MRLSTFSVLQLLLMTLFTHGTAAQACPSSHSLNNSFASFSGCDTSFTINGPMANSTIYITDSTFDFGIATTGTLTNVTFVIDRVNVSKIVIADLVSSAITITNSFGIRNDSVGFSQYFLYACGGVATDSNFTVSNVSYDVTMSPASASAILVYICSTNFSRNRVYIQDAYIRALTSVTGFVLAPNVMDNNDVDVQGLHVISVNTTFASLIESVNVRNSHLRLSGSLAHSGNAAQVYVLNAGTGFENVTVVLEDIFVNVTTTIDLAGLPAFDNGLIYGHAVDVNTHYTIRNITFLGEVTEDPFLMPTTVPMPSLAWLKEIPNSRNVTYVITDTKIRYRGDTARFITGSTVASGITYVVSNFDWEFTTRATSTLVSIADNYDVIVAFVNGSIRGTALTDMAFLENTYSSMSPHVNVTIDGLHLSLYSRDGSISGFKLGCLCQGSVLSLTRSTVEIRGSNTPQGISFLCLYDSTFTMTDTTMIVESNYTRGLYTQVVSLNQFNGSSLEFVRCNVTAICVSQTPVLGPPTAVLYGWSGWGNGSVIFRQSRINVSNAQMLTATVLHAFGGFDHHTLEVRDTVIWLAANQTESVLYVTASVSHSISTYRNVQLIGTGRALETSLDFNVASSNNLTRSFTDVTIALMPNNAAAARTNVNVLRAAAGTWYVGMNRVLLDVSAGSASSAVFVLLGGVPAANSLFELRDLDVIGTVRSFTGVMLVAPGAAVQVFDLVYSASGTTFVQSRNLLVGFNVTDVAVGCHFAGRTGPVGTTSTDNLASTTFDNVTLLVELGGATFANRTCNFTGPSPNATSSPSTTLQVTTTPTPGGSTPAPSLSAGQQIAASLGLKVVVGDGGGEPVAGAGMSGIAVKGTNCSYCTRSIGSRCACDTAIEFASIIRAFDPVGLTAPSNDTCHKGVMEVHVCAARSTLAEDAVTAFTMFGSACETGNPAMDNACLCPAGTIERRLPMLVPAAVSGFQLRNVTMCAKDTISTMLISSTDPSVCVQPLGSNFSCRCGGGYDTVTVEVAYWNESSTRSEAGLLVVCGAAPAEQVYAAQAAVTTAITIAAGLASGPTAALIQGASMALLTDCQHDDKLVDKVGGRSAVTPFDIPIGSPRIGGWLAMLIITVGAVTVHTLFTSVLTGVNTIKDRRTAAAADDGAGEATKEGSPIDVGHESPRTDSKPTDAVSSDDEGTEGRRPRTARVSVSVGAAEEQHPIALADDEEGRPAMDDGAAESPRGDSADATDGIDQADEKVNGEGAAEAAEPYRPPFERAAMTLRFPNLSIKAFLYGFQGLVFQSLLLMRQNDRTAGEVVIGALGCFICIGFVIFGHVWGSVAGRDEAIKQATYVGYERVFARLPAAVRTCLLPPGFWNGNMSFTRRFGSLFDSFGARHVHWIVSVYQWRAVIVAVLISIQPTSESACYAVMMILAASFFVFGGIFAAFRPHRGPVDDFLAVALNMLSGVVSILVAVQSGSVAGVYLVVVYVALGGTVYTVTLSLAEMLFLRKRALAYQDEERPDDAKENDATVAKTLTVEDEAVKL